MLGITVSIKYAFFDDSAKRISIWFVVMDSSISLYEPVMVHFMI